MVGDGASGVALSRGGCAQIADHLDENHQKTAIMAEVVCTLGRLPTRAILNGTQHRLPTPPQRPTARTRIGYEHVDRLLSYPQANNLSAWWQPIHIAATNPRNGSASASRRANAGNIKAACRSTDKPSNTQIRAPHQHAQIFLNSHRVRQSPPQCRVQFSHTFSNFESKTLMFCGFRGVFQDMTGELRAKFMEVSPVRVWAGERNT